VKRVFIVGCPRSGTTLLQTLLAAHGELVSPPETHFFNYLVPRSFAKHLRVASRSGRDRIVQHMAKIGLDFRAPSSCWTSEWSKALVECLDALAREESANGWIEKTPAHLHFVDLIEKLIPDARFVHIVRNGKDTCASLYEAASRYPEAWGGKRSAKECAERWIHDVTISERKARDVRHKLILYEKLVNDPHNVIVDVLEFLKVKQGAWQKSEQVFREAFENVVLLDEPWKEFRAKVEANTGKFNTVFDDGQRRLVEALIAKAGPVIGGPVVCCSQDAATRIRAAEEGK
jgi:LPS sulfotransferase NodH